MKLIDKIRKELKKRGLDSNNMDIIRSSKNPDTAILYFNIPSEVGTLKELFLFSKTDNEFSIVSIKKRYIKKFDELKLYKLLNELNSTYDLMKFEYCEDTNTVVVKFYPLGIYNYKAIVDSSVNLIKCAEKELYKFDIC